MAFDFISYSIIKNSILWTLAYCSTFVFGLHVHIIENSDVKSKFRQLLAVSNICKNHARFLCLHKDWFVFEQKSVQLTCSKFWLLRTDSELARFMLK